MRQTSKYQLNLIENSDRFLAEPINENMQALENALVSHSTDTITHSDIRTDIQTHASDTQNPHGVTISQLGAAAASHNHSAANITSGILPTARGGTGNTSVDTTPTSGSAKMVTSGGVYTALAGKSDTSHTHSAYAAASHTHSTYAASSHNHVAGNITSGTLPVARGGTGNTSVDTTPTSGSTKMVTSGGVYTALTKKYGTDNLPWITGTYTGTGTANVPQTVNLGFQPSAVLVVCPAEVCLGIAIRSGNTVGAVNTYYQYVTGVYMLQSTNLAITATGFSVHMGHDSHANSLNAGGKTYVYIAFK